MYTLTPQRSRRSCINHCAAITGILLYTAVFSPHVLAEYVGDCSVMLDGTQGALSSLGAYAQENTSIDKATLTLALQNLGHYCCAYDLLDPENGGCKETKDLKGGADSPYLFDQLLDLSYRRLDAADDESLRYGLPADTKGSERQKKLTDLGDTEKKYTPSDIQQAYGAARPLGTPPFISSDTCALDKDGTPYNSLTLDQRYAVACGLASCIAGHALKATSDLTDASRAATTENMCADIYKTRVNQETDYVRQLQVRVGMRNVTNILQQYTQNYFIDTRRSMLYDEMTALSQNLTFVNRKVQEGTPACSGK